MKQYFTASDTQKPQLKYVPATCDYSNYASYYHLPCT